MLKRERRASARPSASPRWAAVVGVGLLAALVAHDAAAAALGSAVVASTGLLATLLTLFAMKGWSAIASAETASTAGGALLVAAAAAWLVPNRGRQRDQTAAGERSGSPPDPNSELAVAMRAHGLDPEQLRTEMVTLFCRVQRAWDQVELAALRDITTPDMLAELVHERAYCLPSSGTVRTVIVEVEAELLGYEQLSTAAIVTVAFSGLLSEDAARPAFPFREVWLLTKVSTDPQWKLARHQTLY